MGTESLNICYSTRFKMTVILLDSFNGHDCVKMLKMLHFNGLAETLSSTVAFECLFMI